MRLERAVAIVVFVDFLYLATLAVFSVSSGLTVPGFAVGSGLVLMTVIAGVAVTVA